MVPIGERVALPASLEAEISADDDDEHHDEDIRSCDDGLDK